MPSPAPATDFAHMELQRFEILVEAISDYAIYMLDDAGHVVSWNTGAERFKGYMADEIIGRHFSQFFTPEDKAEGLPARILAMAASEGRFESEGWRMRKDGSRFWANAVVQAIRSDDGRLLGFAKVTRDVSEQRAAAETLKRTEQALQHAQKMESIGKLTGGVAHDFNNLLQIISGNLQLLAVELAHNQLAQSRITAALNGVHRGAKLASYLLAFGRRQALDPKVVNAGNFVMSMEDMLRRTLGEAVEIETVVSGGLWNTQIDIVQLESALLNLVINARDAIAAGGKITIEVGNAFLDDEYVRTRPDVAAGQYVMLAVSDNGSGMPPEVVAQAFEPFFSTKPEGRGSGLGLSMVYGFVKQSGGHVQIYSELGHGTTVKLYFPRSFKPEDAAPAPARDVIVGGEETILVAEDDPQLCTTVVEMLTQLGYRVLKTHDASGALAIVESGIHIDLLFTDVVMPGTLSSPDLARLAKQRLPDLAVLFTSGYTQNAIVHGGRLDPGVELLPKPYTREALARKVRHVLANQKHLQQLEAELRRHMSAAMPPPASPLRRLLLVEDEDVIRSHTGGLLKSRGYAVIAVGSAEAALRALEHNAIDIAIVDVGLPDMSGVELAAAMKAKRPHLGIIYATGHGTLAGVEDGLLLSKPYSIDSIEAMLRQLENGN